MAGQLADPHKSLLVYDLDGTLVDSAKVVVSILNSLRQGLGLNDLSVVSVLASISLGGEDLIRNALGVSGGDVNIYLNKFREMYFDLPTPEDCVYQNVFETLSSLNNRGFNFAICTNKPRKLADKVLRETKLDVFFNSINAGGDLITKKPDRVNLQACINYFDSTFDKIYLVGDSTVDQQLAVNADVPFIFYAPGYDDGVDQKKTVFTLHDHLEILCLI